MSVYKTTRDKKVITGYSSLVVGLTVIMAIFVIMDDSIGRLLFFLVFFLYCRHDLFCIRHGVYFL